MSEQSTVFGNEVLKGLSIALSIAMLTACGGGGGSSSPKSAQPTVENPGSDVSENEVQGMLSGVVVADENGNPVRNANLSVADKSTTTDRDGRFHVALTPADRIVIVVEAAGYAKAIEVVSVSSAKTSFLPVRMLKVGVAQAVNVSVGGTVAVPGSTAQVDIPGDGLIRVLGGNSAASVTVEVTPIASGVDLSDMPGELNTLVNNASVPIESFGALVVEIKDQDGNAYNLKDGASATIRIPLSTKSSNPSNTIPLYYIDETTGRWVEEGIATLVGSAPSRFYEGTVNHFSVWNADQVMDTVYVSGCLAYADGSRAREQYVISSGSDYSGEGYDYSSAEGTFRVGIRKQGTASVSAATYDPTLIKLVPNGEAVTVGPSDADIVLNDCLTVPAPSVTIMEDALPSAYINQYYESLLTSINGVGNSAWSVVSGALPDGVTLDVKTGLLSGTPTEAGRFDFTVRAVDASTEPRAFEKPLSLKVFAASEVKNYGEVRITSEDGTQVDYFTALKMAKKETSDALYIDWNDNRVPERLIRVTHRGLSSNDLQRGVWFADWTASAFNNVWVCNDSYSNDYHCGSISTDFQYKEVIFDDLKVFVENKKVFLNGVLSFAE